MAVQLPNGKWFGPDVDPDTGKPIDPRTGGAVGSSVQNPFNKDYINQHASKFQPNPFQPGTKEYQQFLNEQIKNNIDQAGAPDRPSFNSQIDPATGLLRPELISKSFGVSDDTMQALNDRYNKVNLNKDPLKALEGEAARTGPSAWAKLQQQAIDARKLDSLDKVAATANGANAGAANSLAMRGGLNSGARTSLAKEMMRGINANSQAVNRGASNDALTLGIQDEANRMDIAKALPQMELQALQPEMQRAQDLNAASLNAAEFNAGQKSKSDQFNIQSALNENLQNRGYDLNNYNELMKAWGAQKTGDAVSGGGKK